MESTPPGNERELADLVALADGSLDPARQAEVQARVDADPRLRALLDEQRRAVGLVRATAAEARAPLALRERIEADRRRLGPRAKRRRLGVLGGLAGALAAVALALVLTLPGAAPGGPTVVQAVGLSALPPMTAPPARSDDSKLLVTSVDGVAYPYWEDSFAWQTSGARRDRLHGRDTATVFYDRNGTRLGYTIVSGSALKTPSRAQTTVLDGVTLHSFAQDGRTVVTWLRSGHTCVLAGANVPLPVLLKLAAWKGKGGVPF
jgi:anti-sigma factor RsiW